MAKMANQEEFLVWFTLRDIVAFAAASHMTKNGILLGAIGVSGASADEDELCAQAAIDAVMEDLQ